SPEGTDGPALLDRQGSFHSRFPVARDGAEEGVVAGTEVGGDGGLAGADQWGDGDFFAFGAFDRDVVFERRRIVEVDRHLARLAGQRFLFVGESRRGSGQLDGAAWAFDRWAFSSFFGAFSAFRRDRFVLFFFDLLAGR